MFKKKPNLTSVEVAKTGAIFLAGIVDRDGRFKYRYTHATGKAANGYNVLRHCGTIWAMLSVHSTVGAGETILPAARRATAYLLNSFFRFHRDIDAACICEENTIKLGGNALAILALLSMYEGTGDNYLLHTATRLGESIIRTRHPDGDFIHKRYFKSGKISAFRSEYYTGEAFLALIKLFEATKDDRFLNAVVECENTLAKQDYGVPEQSHWMLYSLEALSRHRKCEENFLHAEKIARHILGFPKYRSWERSTPTACRSEGLLAFLRMTREEGADPTLRESCIAAVRENLELQLAFRHDDGAFVRGGDIERRGDEVRIDYVQHNISSFLDFHLYGNTT